MAETGCDREFLVLHFPEFDTELVTESRVRALNETAQLYVNEGVFGTSYRYALALVIAHLLKLSQNEGNGPVESQDVGDLSITYGKIEGGQLTAYGREFNQLAQMKGLNSPTRKLFV